jgi:hypothetical protein
MGVLRFEVICGVAAVLDPHHVVERHHRGQHADLSEREQQKREQHMPVESASGIERRPDDQQREEEVQDELELDQPGEESRLPQ